MLSRQINNNNLQNFISDAKGSILKLNDYSNKTNNQKYYYDAYGSIVYNTENLNTNLIWDEASLSLRNSDNKNSNLTLHKTRSSSFLCSSVMTVENQLQYNGERVDNNSKLQYLRARFYNSETKRFINQDVYQFFNKFEYVNANPIMNIDPSGNSFSSWLDDNWKMIAIAGAATIVSIIAVYIVRAYYKRQSALKSERLHEAYMTVLKNQDNSLIPGVTFWHEYEENGFLSNWWTRPDQKKLFTYKEKDFISSEQAFMWEKANFFKQEKIANKILTLTNQKKIKTFDVRAYSQSSQQSKKDWHEASYNIMKKIVEAKFAQNSDLKEKLLATDGNPIYEASPFDGIWGIGFDKFGYDKNKKYSNLDSGSFGKNRLGTILMEIRKNFMDEKSSGYYGVT